MSGQWSRQLIAGACIDTLKSHLAAVCSNQHSATKAAAERTGRPIFRSQSAGDLGDSPEPGVRHGSASPSKRSTLSAGTFNGDDVSHHLAWMLHMSVQTILNRPNSPCPHALGQWPLHCQSLDKDVEDCGHSAAHRSLCDMQGEEASLRQNAARGPRTITLPQRPSRLDPSSDRGRTTNQGGLLSVTINLPTVTSVLGPFEVHSKPVAVRDLCILKLLRNEPWPHRWRTDKWTWQARPEQLSTDKEAPDRLGPGAVSGL